jgi:hypothetical protein
METIVVSTRIMKKPRTRAHSARHGGSACTSVPGADAVRFAVDVPPVSLPPVTS